MKTIAFIVGIIAVTFYLLGYQQKKRKNIIFFNVTSRILYILQYILLSAFEGAVLDVAGVVSSVLAQKKDKPIIRKNLKAFIIGVNILIVISGLLVYNNFLSILPIIGVLLHTSAFWISDEKIIRRVSLLGCPFWLVYNFASGAYGSCIGDLLSIFSLLTAMLRFDCNFSKKTTLLLIRHGESRANVEQIFGGHFDAELTENGFNQAKITGEFIKENYKVNKVYSSDLKRAFSTGNCIAEINGVEIIKEQGLREIYGGKWEGIKYAELSELYKEEYEIWKNHTGKARCTGGESVKELGERIINTLEKIAKENLGRTIVISTHATPVRVTQCLVETGSLDEMENTPWVSNASVTELIYNNGKWTLGRVGIDEHLSEYRTTLPSTV